MDVTPQIIHAQNFAEDGARFIVARAQEAFAKSGIFRLGLTGGRSPRAIHEALVKLGQDLPWGRVQLTFGDERCVPPEHEDSNYRVAYESLIAPAQIPPGNVFRMRGEIDPGAAAQEYEERLHAVATRFGEERYTHDLLLLGLGEDGHIASLFPGSPALQEISRNVLPAVGPKPPPQRITMTFPLLNAARQILFLVPDIAKREIVDQVLAGQARYPASRVSAGEQITWLLGW